MQQYPSSVSVYQADVATPGEVRSPGDYGTPVEASHHKVNHKVSAWLQQTDDSDATSQGENLFGFVVSVTLAHFLFSFE